jgi:hypothetical protein
MDEYLPSDVLQWLDETLTLERHSFVNRIGGKTYVDIASAVSSFLSSAAPLTKYVYAACSIASSSAYSSAVTVGKFVQAAVSSLADSLAAAAYIRAGLRLSYRLLLTL